MGWLAHTTFTEELRLVQKMRRWFPHPVLMYQLRSIKGSDVDGKLKKADTIVVGFNLLEKYTSY